MFRGLNLETEPGDSESDSDSSLALQLLPFWLVLAFKFFFGDLVGFRRFVICFLFVIFELLLADAAADAALFCDLLGKSGDMVKLNSSIGETFEVPGPVTVLEVLATLGPLGAVFL